MYLGRNKLTSRKTHPIFRLYTFRDWTLPLTEHYCHWENSEHSVCALKGGMTPNVLLGFEINLTCLHRWSLCQRDSPKGIPPKHSNSPFLQSYLSSYCSNPSVLQAHKMHTSTPPPPLQVIVASSGSSDIPEIPAGEWFWYHIFKKMPPVTEKM